MKHCKVKQFSASCWKVVLVVSLLLVAMLVSSNTVFAAGGGGNGDSGDLSYTIVEYKRSHFSGYKVENAYLLGDILCTSGMSEMTKEGEAIACDFVFS